MQVAISKPVSQDLYDVEITNASVAKQSPFYPTGYLLSGNISISQGYCHNSNKDTSADLWTIEAAKTRNNSLYIAMSNEFDFRRNDVISKL